MKARAGTDIVHVPYRGIADATKDLLGGSIQAMTASIPATLPLLAEKRVQGARRDGRPKRIPQLPGVPSWQEEGVPNANVDQLLGHRRAGRHAARTSSRSSTRRRRRCSRSPTCESALEREGAELIPGPPERLGALIERDLANWKKLIADAKLTFE